MAKKQASTQYIACVLLVLCLLGLIDASNQPPTLQHHVRKLAVIAGKLFRWVIPMDLYLDPEDGSNLAYALYVADGTPPDSNSWIQFNPTTREVYGLPLEEHVSRWSFTIEAQDSEGLSAQDNLQITVQQHKNSRTVNHQFIMQFELTSNFNNSIDWQSKALEALDRVLFTDETRMDQLTVRSARQNGNNCEIVWEIDFLSSGSACPMEDIGKFMKLIESETEAGKPSASLIRALSPELAVTRVSWRGMRACSPAPMTSTVQNFPPVTRNKIDRLTATAGHLFVYKIPQDTFFDPEDGDTLNLQLKLKDKNWRELSVKNWLQFDSKNQELYGLPAPEDEGVTSYILIAQDSQKMSTNDNLLVEVVKASTINPTYKFEMILDYPFSLLAYIANNKKNVVEKLAALFGQMETDNIQIESITDNPTTITWYNTSLPTNKCAKREIDELHKMIIENESGSSATVASGEFSAKVDRIFGDNIKVMSIRFIPLGICAVNSNSSTENVRVYIRTRK